MHDIPHIILHYIIYFPVTQRHILEKSQQESAVIFVMTKEIQSSYHVMTLLQHIIL
jgi:hypothetical protein